MSLDEFVLQSQNGTISLQNSDTTCIVVNLLQDTKT